MLVVVCLFVWLVGWFVVVVVVVVVVVGLSLFVCCCLFVGLLFIGCVVIFFVRCLFALCC